MNLTPFPVATAILAGFTHAQRGSSACVEFLRAYTPGLCGFAIFCVMLRADAAASADRGVVQRGARDPVGVADGVVQTDLARLSSSGASTWSLVSLVRPWSKVRGPPRIRTGPRTRNQGRPRTRDGPSTKDHGPGTFLWPRQHLCLAAETLQDDDRLRVFTLLIARGGSCTVSSSPEITADRRRIEPPMGLTPARMLWNTCPGYTVSAP